MAGATFIGTRLVRRRHTSCFFNFLPVADCTDVVSGSIYSIFIIVIIRRVPNAVRVFITVVKVDMVDDARAT